MRKILVIEDNRELAEVLEQALEGNEVLILDDVAKIQNYSAFSPHYVLSDLSLPPTSDPDKIIFLIRSIFLDSKLILISGSSTLSAVARKHQCAFLKKPIDLDDLCAIVT